MDLLNLNLKPHERLIVSLADSLDDLQLVIDEKYTLWTPDRLEELIGDDTTLDGSKGLFSIAKELMLELVEENSQQVYDTHYSKNINSPSLVSTSFPTSIADFK